MRNIYDEKRRNSVEAYCGVQMLTPTERCIQLEDTITTLESQLAQSKVELASVLSLPAYRIGYIDARADASAAVAALHERHKKMNHLTAEDMLDYAEREAEGGVPVGVGPRETAVNSLESQLHAKTEECEKLRTFFERMGHEVWGYSEPDAGDFHEYAVEQGLLVPVPADEEFKAEWGAEEMYVFSWSPLALTPEETPDG